MIDPVEIYFDELKFETDHAMLVDIDGRKEWFPKSQCRITEPGVMEVSEWLAIEKGLV